VLILGAAIPTAAEDSTWPSFLPPRASVPEAPRVERIWAGETFRRTLTPAPVDVPLALYVALIDAPDVVAGAARQLGVATESVTSLGDGSWEVRSEKGSRAVYRVLASDPDRRVVLSHGHVMVLGLAIPGSVLGVLELRDRTTSVDQRLTVHARIENAALALVAKFLVALLPSLADAELARGFRITAAVATWAGRERAEFCAWLGSTGLASPRIATAAGCETPAR
jgi:hypothetical protein